MSDFSGEVSLYPINYIRKQLNLFHRWRGIIINMIFPGIIFGSPAHLSRKIFFAIVIFLTFLVCFGKFLQVFALPAASSFAFTRNLMIGDVGKDVLKLQQMLNSDPDTVVALTGPGSPGYETENFGLLTKSAVIKFQEKYASEVLSPIGLSRGTGFVGAKTILKIEQLATSGVKTVSEPVLPSGNLEAPVVSGSSGKETLSQDPLADFRSTPGDLPDLEKTDKWLAGVQERLNQAAASVSSGVVQNVSVDSFGIGAPTVIIQSLSHYSGKSGANLVIVGSGFSLSGNDVYFGKDYVLRNIKSVGSNLTFTLPSFPAGRYKVVVVNKNGVSNSSFFIVTEGSAPKVFVKAASPEVVSLGETITLKGEGFLNDNEIKTSYGIIEHVQSQDGKTLSFVVEPKQLVGVKRPEDKAPVVWQVAVYVVNQNGVSEQPVFFSLSL